MITHKWHLNTTPQFPYALTSNSTHELIICPILHLTTPIAVQDLEVLLVQTELYIQRAIRLYKVSMIFS